MNTKSDWRVKECRSSSLRGALLYENDMTVRMGMIGAGRMSNTHANCLAKISEAKIVAVADVMPERAQDFALPSSAFLCGKAPGIDSGGE